MIERRRAVRTKVFLAAQIRTARRPPLVIDCVVRDVSPLGARLELRDTSTLPNIFELTFDAGRTLRACHVVWRTPTDVGVEFSPNLQQSTNDDTAWTGNRSILNRRFFLDFKRDNSLRIFHENNNAMNVEVR